MRLTLLCTVVTVWLSKPALSIYEDQAFQTDWQISLVGTPTLRNVFFHRPQKESKASLIYSFSEENVLAAINPKDGEVVWRKTLSGQGDSFVKRGSSNVITGLGNSISSWSALDGKLLWSSEFKERIQGLTIQQDENIAVLFMDSSVRTLNYTSGQVIKEWRGDGQRSDSSRIVSFYDKLYTLVTSEGRLKVHAVADGNGISEIPVGESSADSSVQVVHASENSGVLLWSKGQGRLYCAQLVFGGSLKASNVITEDHFDSVEVTELSASEYLLLFKASDMSWLELYTWTDRKFERKLKWPRREGNSFVSVSSTRTSDHQLFSWTTSLGNMHIYNKSNTALLKEVPLGKEIMMSIEDGVSEILQKSDGSIAVRAFIIFSNGDTGLFRDGDVVWTRKESLAGSKLAAWAEIPDLKTEEIKAEIDLEAHQRLVGAWMHRVRRHTAEVLLHGPGWLASLPARISRNVYSTQTEDGMGKNYRDGFGYQKLLVIITKRGYVAAINVGRRGTLVWENRQPIIDQTDSVKALMETRTGVLMAVTSSGKYLEIEALTGDLLFTKDLGGSIMEVAGSKTPNGLSVVAILNSKGKISSRVLTASELPQPVYLAHKTHTNEIQGLRVDGENSLSKTWIFSPPGGGVVDGILGRPLHDPVASIGRVLNDRSVMYKYLNPHTIFTSVASPTTSTLTVYLLDAVSGKKLYSATHNSIDATKAVQAVISENWLVYIFYADDEFAPDAPRGYQIVSVDLYESVNKNDRGRLGDFADIVSSLDVSIEDDTPHAEAKSYMLPSGVLSVGTTVTLQGISSHEVLLYLFPSKNLVSIPRRVLSASRPVDREPNEAEREEALARYVPVINIEPSAFLNHQRSLASEKAKILVTPSLLESTSIVVLLGNIDIFGTRISPSLEFDVLGKSFNKLQLIGTVIALLVGVSFVKPLVERKSVERRWRSQT